MTEKAEPAGQPATPFDKFKDLAAKLVRTPKKDVDAKEAEYRRSRAKRKGRKPT